MPKAAFQPPRFLSWGFFLMGLALTCVFGYLMVWPPIRANLFFEETTCVVLDKRLAEQHGEDGKTYRPEIHIEYKVGGVPQRTWTYDAAGVFSNERDAHERTLAQFQVGGSYPCWFDPGKPDRAVLTRRFSWWCLMVLIPVAFMTFGAAGLMSKRPPPAGSKPSDTLNPEMKRLGVWFLAVFFGGFFVAMVVSGTLIFAFVRVGTPPWVIALMFFGPFLAYVGVLVFVIVKYVARIRRNMPSPEKAAAAEVLDALPAEAESCVWPTIPTPEGTPGRRLRHRLVSSTSPGVFLAVMLGVALFWNGIVSVFLFHMAEGHLAGKPDWCLTAFLVPFVLIGLGLIAVLFAAGLQFVTSLLAGKVSVEMSESAMRPGRAYEFVVEQSGLFRLGQVRLVLACTESATYTAGTNTRTETKEVANEGIARAEPMPAEGLCGTLTVPGDAMHSFESAHNKITWTLRVKGRVIGILPYQSEYPVLILPPAEGASP